MIKLIEKIGLSQKERQVLFRVFIASFGLSICIAGAIWLLSYSKHQKSQSRLVSQSSPHLKADQKATHLQDIDIQAHRYAARYYASTNQPLQAISHYHRILEARPKDTDAHVALATGYMEGGLFQESIHLLENLSQDDTNDSLAALIKARLGLALFHTGRIEESIHILESCLQDHPQCAEAACFRGQVEAAVNPSSPAVKSYLMKAVELDSTYMEAWYQLARYSMNKPQVSREDYLNARDHLLKVLTYRPLHAKAHSRLGMVYYYLEQPGPAQKSYETALALNPDDYNTRFNLGELYYTMWDNTAEALRAFKRTVELKKDHTKGNFRIGMISLKNDMKREAVHYLEQAHRSDTDNIRILLQLAVAYERLGTRDMAVQTYKKILRLDALNDIARHKVLLMSRAD